MDSELNPDIVDYLRELRFRLDLSNTSRKGNLYHKAYKIIEKDTQLHGLPALERAYHLCIVGGVPENEVLIQERVRSQTMKLDHKGNAHRVHPNGKKIKPKQSQFGKKYF